MDKIQKIINVYEHNLIRLKQLFEGVRVPSVWQTEINDAEIVVEALKAYAETEKFKREIEMRGEGDRCE
jgi:G:T-mismatch repair DNA endonuclease (very short patch repair protein)